MSKIVFSDFCINGQIVTPDVHAGECEVSEDRCQHRMTFKVNTNVFLDMNVQESLREFKFSKWVSDPDVSQILDFNIKLRSIPSWLSIYSTPMTGCAHILMATLKVKCSESNYKDFTDLLCSALSTMQCQILEDSVAVDIWKKRCEYPTSRVIKSIKFRQPNLGGFASQDLERLKYGDRWLSDAHVTFSLQDCFGECAGSNIWGSLNVKLLDTTTWSQLSEDPERYRDRYRTKHNLLECDFIVIPMFEDNHWRLGIVEKPAEFMDGNTVFHILDSYRDGTGVKREANQLQKILLKHFDDATFKAGRIATNVAKVPQQPNTTDCGCFVIYFAKKFFNSPESTMALIKTPFSSATDGMTAWGLTSLDLSFVRREIRTLLFKYLDQDEAYIEYSE